MMSKVIFTKGIQGAGKSTWAKEYCQDKQDWVRVCRDDLRKMRGKYWIPKQEDLISEWEFNCIAFALSRNYKVIVDAINLNEKYLEKLKKDICQFCVSKSINIPEFLFKDFTDVPLEQCIKNDLLRPNSIGEKIIRKTWNKYLAPRIEPYVHIERLPNAIMADLDGTLALFGDKNPYERDFINDIVNKPVKQIIDNYLSDDQPLNNLIIFSGRSDRFKEETKQWLDKYGIYPNIFEMRTAEEEKAQIKDVKVKQRLFDTFVRGKYNIDFVLDDRNSVVEFWRSLGLTCLQVQDGNF